MAEFSLGFADELAQMAVNKASKGLETPEARQAVVYVARVSIEIAMKALLEQAGIPKRQIMDYKHDLRRLLAELGRCTVERENASGITARVPATDIRAKKISAIVAQTTVGLVIEAEIHGASRYPAYIRYGDTVRDFPPEAVANAATALIEWAKEHWIDIKA